MTEWLGNTVFAHTFGQHMTTWVILLRIAAAVIIGAVIGIDREIKNRPAGMRTHVLVCMGAALVALIEQQQLADVAARQKIFSYAREGWQLPDGWAMDKDGNPTNDPQEAINGLLMPVGGHKGAGLAAMIDIILGTLSGGTYGRSICANTVTDKAQHISHLFFLMNPDFYMSREGLDGYIAQYVSDFKAVRRKKDVPEILLPGELEWKTTQERRANGIPVSAAVLKELNAFADQIGVAHLE